MYDFTGFWGEQKREVFNGFSYLITRHCLGHHCLYVAFENSNTRKNIIDKLKKEIGKDGINWLYDGIANYLPFHKEITFSKYDANGVVLGCDYGHYDDCGGTLESVSEDAKKIISTIKKRWKKKQC